MAGAGAWETSPRWLPDGSGLLVASDRDGWFQVVRVPLDGGDRTALTSGAVDHGDYLDGFGMAPLPSPDGTRFVHPLLHDGLADLVVAPLAAAAPARRGPGRPPKRRPDEAAPGPGVRIDPFDGVWRAVGWLPDGSAILAIGETERDPEDFWILPVPAADGPRARPRRLTARCRPSCPSRGFVEPERLDGPGARRAGDPGHPLAPRRRHREARREDRPDHRPRPRRPLVAGPPRLPAASASSWSRRASPSCRSTSAARPATAATSAWRTSANGATPTSTT